MYCNCNYQNIISKKLSSQEFQEAEFLFEIVPLEPFHSTVPPNHCNFQGQGSFQGLNHYISIFYKITNLGSVHNVACIK